MESFHSIDKIISEISSPDRLFVAIVAVLMVSLIGIITGPLTGNANPYFWALFDRIVGGMARRGYVKTKSTSTLLFRGTFFTILFLITACVFGAALYMLKRYLPLGGMMEPILLALLCSGGAVIVSVYRLFLAMNRNVKDKDDKRGSFGPVAITARADLNTVDDFGMARIGAGVIPVTFDRGLVMPIFWYVIGGLPLAFIVTGMSAAKWALAKNGFAKGYGALALSLETLFGFVPRIVSSILLILSSLLTPHAGVTRSLISIFSWKNQAPSAEGGLPLTIMAYALNVSLGGPVQDIDGSPLQQKFVGPKNASARVDAGVLKQACYMGAMAHILLLALLLGLLVLMRALATAAATATPIIAPAIGTM
jgi:adenosylcobinamide-phosphate synthase